MRLNRLIVLPLLSNAVVSNGCQPWAGGNQTFNATASNATANAINSVLFNITDHKPTNSTATPATASASALFPSSHPRSNSSAPRRPTLTPRPSSTPSVLPAPETAAARNWGLVVAAGVVGAAAGAAIGGGIGLGLTGCIEASGQKVLLVAVGVGGVGGAGAGVGVGYAALT